MSTCPDKDIHSLYLDNELPENYAAEYEQHIHSCSKCRETLAKQRRLHELLAEDSKNITLTPFEMDASYDRLKARLSYKRVAHKPLVLGKAARAIFKDMCIGAAAAAAVIAILPLRMNGAQRSAAPAFTPIARQTSFSLPTANGDGNVAPIALSTFLGEDESSASPARTLNGASLQAQSAVAAMVMPFGSTIGATAEAEPIEYMNLTSYDVFSPIEEPVQDTAQQHGFFLHFSSPLVSIDIGNTK